MAQDAEGRADARSPQGNRGMIGAALHSDADYKLLRGLLAQEPCTVMRLQGESIHGASVDLFVVDPVSLDRWGEALGQRRREADPVVLPVLVLATQGQWASGLVERELGQRIDDVVRIPTTGRELRARVANLLRLRALSLSQHRAHHAARQALAGLSRALRTLHACNEVMLRETTEEGLLSAVCRVITHLEDYALAWIGFAKPAVGQPPRQVIAKAAVAGPAAEFARQTEVHIGQTPEGQGPSGRAIASGATQIITDLASDASVAPWRMQIAAWGLGSLISLPLRPRRGAPGVLCVYSTQAGDFAGDERELLERLAANLVFGLDKLRMERERQRQAGEIQRLAYHDPLTGLPNRRFLLQQFHDITHAAEAGKAQAAAVLFIDINDFKLVNDALGHAAGDTILQSIGQRIRATLRHGDWVIRQGGDEFIVLMLDAPRQPRSSSPEGEASGQRLAEDAEALATRIIQALRQPFAIEGFDHRIGAAIGISLFPYLGRDPETVLSQADTAMYRAKQAGNGIALYTPETAAVRHRRFSLEARLHHALEHEEFTLHYQPLWEIGSARIIGVEALLRWTDAHGRQTSPGEFIPVAEEIGLIGPIGEWVLSTAASQLVRWRAEGLALTMSANLAVRQLQGRDAATRIMDLATGSGAKPQWWSLEVTEDLLMHDVEVVERAMRPLSDQGFRFALDDFGRGYSSLARLKSLPLHTLKIDKFFIDELGEGEQGASIITAIIDMARNLSMRTLAEGIETDRQRERLTRLGCQWGQGFWLSAARPPEEIPGLAAQARDAS